MFLKYFVFAFILFNLINCQDVKAPHDFTEQTRLQEVDISGPQSEVFTLSPTPSQTTQPSQPPTTQPQDSPETQTTESQWFLPYSYPEDSKFFQDDFWRPTFYQPIDTQKPKPDTPKPEDSEAARLDRPDDSLSQKPNSTEESQTPTTNRPDNSGTQKPHSPKDSQTPPSNLSDDSRTPKPHYSDESGAEQPYRSGDFRTQRPYYSPEDSQTPRPDDSRTQKPYSSEKSRTPRPDRPEDSRIQKLNSSEESQTQSTEGPDDSRTQKPYSPQDSRAPYQQDDSPPQKSYSPGDSRAPYRPEDSRTQKPYSPEDSRTPRPDDSRAQKPYSEDSKAPRPDGPENSGSPKLICLDESLIPPQYRPQDNRPQQPYSPEDSRAPQPLRPEDYRTQRPYYFPPGDSQTPRPDDSRPQKSYSPEDPRASPPYDQDNSQPLKPYSPEKSRAPQPYRPDDSRPQKPYSPDESLAQQPYNPEDSRPQKPYSPEKSRAPQPYRPEDYRTPKSYSPEDSRTPRPDDSRTPRPDDSRTQKPYSSEDSKAPRPQKSYSPDEPRAQQPYNPEDSRPREPYSEKSRAPQPYRPDDSRPQKPYSPDESRTQKPYSDEDRAPQPYRPYHSRPQQSYSPDRAPQPYSPEDSRPKPYSPDESRAPQPYRPDDSRPQRPYSPEKSRVPQPYQPEDTRHPRPYSPEDSRYERPYEREYYRTPSPDETYPQKSFRPQTTPEDSDFFTYAPYFPTRTPAPQSSHVTDTAQRQTQRKQFTSSVQYEDDTPSTPLAPQRRPQTPRDPKPHPQPDNRFRPDYNSIRRYGESASTTQKPSNETRDRTKGRQTKPKTITQIIENPNLVVDGKPQYFTILRDNLNRGGLLNALSRPSSLTMFVPTDDAFNSLPEGVLDQLQQNPTALRKMLMQHILSFKLTPTSIRNNIIVQSITGEPHVINVIPGGKILVDGVPVIASTSAQNGVVYVISKVLPSPEGKSRTVMDELRKRPELSTFTEIAEQTNYASNLKGPGPYTLFVPSNKAFDNSLSALDEISNNPLAYKDFMRTHITSGAHYSNELRNTQSVPLSGRNFLRITITPDGECVINNSTKITTADITTGNGVIHILDSIIIPPQSLLRQQKGEFSQKLEKPQASQQSIAHMAQRLGTKRFVTWLTKSGIIDDIIKDGREYTIIAPTDKAVGKLPLKIQSLLNTEPRRVKILLEYHVLPGFINVANLTDDEILPSISGKDVRFNKPANSTVMTLSGAPIAREATHGNVMLVSVDNVLYPPQGNVYTIITKSPILKSMVDIIKSANMEEELSQPGPYTIFVPKDEALQQSDPSLVERLKRDSNSSRDFIRKHIILSTMFTSALPVSSDGSRSSSAQAITGDTLKFVRKPNCVSVNGVTLSFSDITATNGVVHVVDHVL